MSASKFATLPFNCYEVGHTWTPNCVTAATDVAAHTFRESIKIYSSCYLLTRIVTKRIPKTLDEFMKFSQDVLQSSIFLCVNGPGSMLTFCIIRNIFGPTNYYTFAFVPALIASYGGILIEKPSRRPLLALYVTNLAIETCFRTLRSNGVVRDIKHFELLLFGLSATTILYYMKKGIQRNDPIGSIFTYIMGKEEFSSTPPTQESTNEPEPPQPESVSSRLKKICKVWIQKGCRLEQLIALCRRQRRDPCPHSSCIDYWVKGFRTRFAAGFGVQASIQLFLQIQILFKSKSTMHFNLARQQKILKACLKSGLGLSSMCFVFRLLSCFFRWLSLSSNNFAGSTIPAFVSTTLGFYILGLPSTLALYLFLKGVETVIAESHKSNNWKTIKWLNSVYGGGWTIPYAISTAILFHTGVMEPHNLKASYTDYLNQMTGMKVQAPNRHLFSVYGTESNQTTMDFWPDYDDKYLSGHMKKLIKLREASGIGNKLMKELTMQFVGL